MLKRVKSDVEEFELEGTLYDQLEEITQFRIHLTNVENEWLNEEQKEMVKIESFGSDLEPVANSYNPGKTKKCSYIRFDCGTPLTAQVKINKKKYFGWFIVEPIVKLKKKMSEEEIEWLNSCADYLDEANQWLYDHIDTSKKGQLFKMMKDEIDEYNLYNKLVEDGKD